MPENGNKIDLGKTPTVRIFWTYAVPSIIAMIAQTTAGLVDSFFIGRYVGPEGLSALSLFFPAVGLLVGLATMVAVGGTTLAGIELGKGNRKTGNNLFNVTVTALILMSLLAVFVMLFLIPHLPDLMGIAGITAEYLIDYGSILSLFFPFFLVNFAFMFFLKLDGKPVFAVTVSLGGTAINIFLDYLLVARMGLEVQGAALATGLSQLIPSLLFFLAIVFKSRWQFRKPRFHRKDILGILFNGSSELLTNIAFSLSGLVFNVVILRRIGVDGVAAYAVALQIANIATALGYGFGESNQSGISYNFGAGNLQRITEFRRMTLRANLAAGLLLFALSFSAGDFLAGIFISEPPIIAMAAYILRFYGVAFLFSGANISIGTYYTAVNDPVRSGLITLYRSLISLLIGLAVFPVLMGDSGLWFAMIFSEASTFLIGLVMIRQRPFGRSIRSRDAGEEPVLAAAAS